MENKDISKVVDTKWRQKYHFMGENGWINDPNGLIYFRGKYHFFYQYNPHDAFWGEMHWGHAVSKDMLHWEYLPIALTPDKDYDHHPKGGCFSGSAIEHEGKLWVFYTGTINEGNGFVQHQCLAYSEDGVNFQKYAGNPIIEQPSWVEPAFFRDPKVWKKEEVFYMVLGANIKENGQALLYKSTNLFDWEFVNFMCESNGELGFMFECPDFFTVDGKDALIFSPMGLKNRTSLNLIGNLNYETGKFIWNSINETDWGHEYYAPQSFEDNKGRRILVAWANSWDWMPFWKDWGPTYKDGWCGHFNVPRVAHIDAKNRLSVEPIEELKQLRSDKKQLQHVSLSNQKLEIPMEDGCIYDMELMINRKKSTAKNFELHLRKGQGKETVVKIDFANQCMSVNKENSDGWSKGESKSPLYMDNDLFDMRILSDTISIEIFAENYFTNHSHNIYADENQNINYIYVENGVLEIEKLVTYKMNNCM